MAGKSTCGRARRPGLGHIRVRDLLHVRSADRHRFPCHPSLCSFRHASRCGRLLLVAAVLAVAFAASGVLGYLDALRAISGRGGPQFSQLIIGLHELVFDEKVRSAFLARALGKDGLLTFWCEHPGSALPSCASPAGVLLLLPILLCSYAAITRNVLFRAMLLSCLVLQVDVTVVKGNQALVDALRQHQASLRERVFLSSDPPRSLKDLVAMRRGSLSFDRNEFRFQGEFGRLVARAPAAAIFALLVANGQATRSRRAIAASELPSDRPVVQGNGGRQIQVRFRPMAIAMPHRRCAGLSRARAHRRTPGPLTRPCPIACKIARGGARRANWERAIGSGAGHQHDAAGPPTGAA